MKPLLLLALLGCLASVFVTPAFTNVKWCVTSDAELRKCMDLARHSPVFSCVRKDRTFDCMVAIRAGEADAITLNGHDIYVAGMANTDLAPIIAEDYAPRREATHEIVHQKRPYYSVAVVKKNSKFRIRDLQGKRSCHTGLGDPEGWDTPMGTLVSLGLIQRPGVGNEPLKQAVREFFHSSCVPGVIRSRNLCNLCKGDCTKSNREPFYGNAGAFKCLEEDGGEVAFVRHDAVPDSEKARYELLCQDNTRAPINSYESCNLGKAGEEDVIPTVGVDSSSCHYAVAVAKKGTTFGINDLRGKRSCHTGLEDFEGWHLPIGTLLTMGTLRWPGIEDEPLVEAVSEFFQSSCIPGAGRANINLCRLCKGDCSKSEREPYYGDAGAFRCLTEDAGEVAFIKHGTVPDSEKANFELLCKDNTRAPLDNYKSCHLGRVPAHAVVSRKDPELAELIWTSLNSVQGFNLFSSTAYAPAKNLMFTDSTLGLVRVPPDTDSFLYLGAEHMSIIRSLMKEQTTSVSSSSSPIKWCAVGHPEMAKCDIWSINTVNFDGQSDIECQSANTVEECVKMIMRKDADAMAMDGGQVYTAGKCGLVPVMFEQYDEAMCGTSEASSYYAVAVVKKGSGVNWDNLQGKRSCHSAIGRSAGWNIPMGNIHFRTKECDFTKFFSHGCAPGANLDSPFCAQCAGSGRIIDPSSCTPNAEEKYYGNSGAFRCLVEDSGDVAFIKHTTVQENTDGNGPGWAQFLRSADFELICPGKGPVLITEFASCHLAQVPAHAVMSRPESRSKVTRILQEQQAKFGLNGHEPTFRMFESDTGSDLLFSDSTKCLKEVQVDNYESFLGSNYMMAMRSLRECSDNTPDLEKSCTFNTCR